MPPIADGERALDDDIRALDGLRDELRVGDESAAELRGRVEAQDAVIRDARRGLETIRTEANELEVLRATAESDLSHLAQTCVDAVQCRSTRCSPTSRRWSRTARQRRTRPSSGRRSQTRNRTRTRSPPPRRLTRRRSAR